MIQLILRLLLPSRNKNSVTYSGTKPKIHRFPRLRNKNNPLKGDIWFDVKHKNNLHVFDGSDWVRTTTNDV